MEYHRTTRGHRFVIYCITFDKTGQYIITGSDDSRVKIWSVLTGFLAAVCRGHQAEITDLAVSSDNSIFASCSIDSTIRVWSLQGEFPTPRDPAQIIPEVWCSGEQLGAPVAVLKGHEGPVNFIDFCPTISGALLSCGTDATCRIWNARNGSVPPLVVSVDAGPRFGVSGTAATRLAHLGVSESFFTVTGSRSTRQTRQTDIHQAGRHNPPRSARVFSNDNGAHVAPEAQQEGQADDASQAQTHAGPNLLVCAFNDTGTYIVVGSNDCSAYIWQWPIQELAPGETWPMPQELCRLQGHSNDVILLQFSKSGERLATGSRDGTVRIWKKPRKWRKKKAHWEQEVCITCPPDEEVIKAARARRRPPPAPCIDQISWAADDSKLVVSVTDFTLRVFHMPTGILHHVLKGHTNRVHVVECHPTDPRVVASASYDGQVIFWDVETGDLLKSFDSRSTRPDKRTWSDSLCFPDGHFSPDGCHFLVSDVAGQFHLYGIGKPCALASRAPYDQFLSNESNQLIFDGRGNAMDASTQLPAHVVTGQELLSDAMGSMYQPTLVAAYRDQRVLSLPSKSVAWREEGRQPAYLLLAPLITAAAWQASELQGFTDQGIANAMFRAQERVTEHEAAQDAAPVGAVIVPDPLDRGRLRGHRGGVGAADRAAARRRREEVAVEADISPPNEPASSGEQFLPPEGGGGGASEEEEDEVISGDLILDEREDDEDDDEFIDDDSEADVHRTRRSSRRLTRSGPARQPTGVQTRETQRSQRELRAMRRQGVVWENGGTQRRSTRARKRARQTDEYVNVDEAELDQGFSSSDEDDNVYQGLLSDSEPDDPSAVSEEQEEEEEEKEEMNEKEDSGAGPGPGTRAMRRRRRTAATQAIRAMRVSNARKPVKRLRTMAVAASGPRSAELYHWLQATVFQPGVYIPQCGDHVVYIKKGHETYYRALNNKSWLPPDGLRHAEPAKVTDVTYIISADGKDYTVASVTLQFTFPQAEPQQLTIEIPPPTAGYAEFVIHESRFEACKSELYLVGAKFQILWQGDEVQWWVGEIVQDRLCDLTPPVSCNDDPRWYDVCQWERLTIAWGSRDFGDQSPWELFKLRDPVYATLEARPDVFRQEVPCIDEIVEERLKKAIETAIVEERWNVFISSPEQDESYPSKHRRIDFYNRLVPLPLSLMEMSERLIFRYYRQIVAFVHDANTISNNAEMFHGPSSQVSREAAALRAFLIAAAGHAQSGGAEVRPVDFPALASSVLPRSSAEPSRRVRLTIRQPVIVPTEGDSAYHEEEEEEEEEEDEEYFKGNDEGTQDDDTPVSAAEKRVKRRRQQREGKSCGGREVIRPRRQTRSRRAVSYAEDLEGSSFDDDDDDED